MLLPLRCLSRSSGGCGGGRRSCIIIGRPIATSLCINDKIANSVRRRRATHFSKAVVASSAGDNNCEKRRICTLLPPSPSLLNLSSSMTNQGIGYCGYHISNRSYTSNRGRYNRYDRRQHHASMNSLGLKVAAGIGITAGTLSTIAMVYC